jgi:general secretion pathway protein D
MTEWTGIKRRARLIVLAGLLVAAVGCAGTRAFRQAQEEERQDRLDAAVQQYTKALEMEPRNTQYRIALARAKVHASQAHFEKGKVYLNSGRPQLAIVEIEQAILLDPTNQYAAEELGKAKAQYERLEAERNEPSKLEVLKEKTRGARAHPPLLEPTSDEPITLNFPQPRPIKQIYQALGQAAGINIVFDPQLKDDNVSIVLSNVSFEDALETLLRQENQFYKTIDEHTILIAADTPQNRKTYEDLVIRTFYLSNGDVTDVANLIRSILNTTHVFPNKAENSITIRDTADKVAIAEQIIEQNDKEKAEVLVDVELLQLNLTKAEDLGLALSQYSLGASLLPAAGATTVGPLTYDELKRLNIRDFGFTIPNFMVQFVKNNTNAELLAKPELRISEGEKAQLIIGDKEPIPTTSFSTQAIGTAGTIVPITSYQYQDVGIKMEMEPRVHHNKEITLKLTIEVSQISGYAPVQSGGQPQPIIGTRSISSTIRLKDGETNFLAGLIRNDKSTTSNQIPFLSDVPVLGRLFTEKNNNDQTTDLMLTITPHIVRIPDITEDDLLPVYVGTEANMSYQGAPRVQSYAGQGPFDYSRSQRSVPGQGREQRPRPVQLAPSSPPRSLFNSIPPQTPPKGPESLQGSASSSDSSKTSDSIQPVDASASSTGSDPDSVLFGFDPLIVQMAPGETRSVTVESVNGSGLAPVPLVVRFDPSVVQVVAADDPSAVVAPGSVTLHFSGGVGGLTPQPIATLTLKAIGSGQSALSFDKNPPAAADGGRVNADWTEGLVVVK